MRRRVTGLATAIVSLASLASCSPPPPAHPFGRVLDLGHPLSATDPTWDGAPAFSRTVTVEFDKHAYTAGTIETPEHFGTHVDAPAHFAQQGKTVDQLAAERLVRPAVCINVVAKVAGADDYAVSVADLTDFEAAHGLIRAASIVLVATGWDSRWPDQTRYMNARDGIKHFPGLTKEAALFLAQERHVWGIGIDTPSIDVGPSTTFEAHRASHYAGLFHIENAANLTELPPTGFTVVVAPLNIKNGSGGPARVFALLPGLARVNR